MRELIYNREAAAAYARRWALGRNPAYYDFEDIGGDCTSFISQCIYAGARVMNFTPIFGWYYLSPSDRTASWTGVEFLYNFLTANESVGPYATECGIEDIEPGDVIQLGRYSGGYYHSLFVTEIRPSILVCAHSYDALDRPLESYDYDRLRPLHIEGVRIW